MGVISFYLQTIALFSVVVVAFLSVLDSKFLMFVLVMEFLIGAYQYIVSSYLMIKGLPGTNLLKMHWKLSTLNLVVIFVVVNAELGSLQYPLIVTVVFILPWTLAILFWYVSFQLYKSIGI